MTVRVHRLVDDATDRDLKLWRRACKRWRNGATGKAWYAKNREKKLAYLKEWRAKNKHREVIYQANKARAEYEKGAR